MIVDRLGVFDLHSLRLQSGDLLLRSDQLYLSPILLFTGSAMVNWGMTPCPGGDNSYVVSICALGYDSLSRGDNSYVVSICALGYYMVFGVSC